MKILFIHNKYQIKGGEDSVLENEMTLLKQNGHSLDLFSVTNDSIKSFFYKINIFLNINYSYNYKNQISKKIKPDVIHVHNFFPILTPSIFDACIEHNVPSVMTLHNFRLICPSALLMHNNKIYEKSIKNTAYSTIIDKVYKNSYLGTYAVARMIEYHKKNNTWKNKVSQFIALTNFAKNKFLEAGFLEHKIFIKPNFSSLKVKLDKNINRSGALFVGRISDEKGIKILLKAWEKIDIKIKIIGNGPLKHLVENNDNSRIEYLGFMNQEQIFNEMQTASFLVFPSIWYEGFPMVIIESFANGLPIIASKLGSMGEIIEDKKTGLHFEPGSSKDLVEKVKFLNENKQEGEQMSANVLSEFKSKYSEKINYETLIKIYKKVIDAKKTKNS